MGKKKKLKREKQIADELFAQVNLLSGQLATVDRILIEACLEGPTIDAWVAQVRIILSALVQARGLVAGPIAQAMTAEPARPPVGPLVRYENVSSGGPVIDGEYTLLTDSEVAAGR